MAIEIEKYLKPLVLAHLAKAIGTCKLMLRQKDGTWKQATADDDIEKALNGDPNMYWIATNQPDTQSFNTLLAYGLDKPKEQPQEVTHSLSEDLAARLVAGRAHIKAKRLESAAIDAELVKSIEAPEKPRSPQRAVPESGTES